MAKYTYTWMHDAYGCISCLSTRSGLLRTTRAPARQSCGARMRVRVGDQPRERRLHTSICVTAGCRSCFPDVHPPLFINQWLGWQNASPTCSRRRAPDVSKTAVTSCQPFLTPRRLLRSGYPIFSSSVSTTRSPALSTYILGIRLEPRPTRSATRTRDERTTVSYVPEASGQLRGGIGAHVKGVEPAPSRVCCLLHEYTRI